MQLPITLLTWKTLFALRRASVAMVFLPSLDNHFTDDYAYNVGHRSKIFPAFFWSKLYKIPTLTRGCVRLKANRSCLAWQHFTFAQVESLLIKLTTRPVEHVWTILCFSLVSK